MITYWSCMSHAAHCILQMLLMHDAQDFMLHCICIWPILHVDGPV